jgi:hypothetical protein
MLALWSLDFRNLYLVNQAYMVLIWKKSDASKVKGYHPISLMHSFSKIFSKILIARLASLMHVLVCPN